MSLKNINYYLNIYTETQKLNYADKKTEIIQKVAFAGLIESGVKFTVEQGRVYLINEPSWMQITDIYPYLSEEWQAKLIYANGMRGLPEPTQRYNYQQSYVQPYDVPVEQPTEQPIENINTFEENTESNLNNSELFQDYDVQEPVMNQTGFVPETEAPVMQEPTYNPADTLQQMTYEDAINKGYETENTEQFSTPTDNSNFIQTDEDEVMFIPLELVSYEDATLEIVDKTNGNIQKFGMKAYPFNNSNGDEIIVRINNLAKGINFTETKKGEIVEFSYEDIKITAVRSDKDDFEVEYTLDEFSAQNYTLTKADVRSGGKGGNILIKDENLIIRIYPVTKGPSKNSAKGPSVSDPIIYYIENGNDIIVSSSKERKPVFNYDGDDYEIVAKWDGDLFRASADSLTMLEG